MSLESSFPNLIKSGYSETSPRDPKYNCIAFAAGKQDLWWDLSTAPEFYWPQGVPRDDKIDTLIRVFESLGYKVCSDGAFESGWEKIAIYGSETEYEHAARQLGVDLWTSKLGKSIDISHRLEALEGGIYGNVVRFLRRPNFTP